MKKPSKADAKASNPRQKHGPDGGTKYTNKRGQAALLKLSALIKKAKVQQQ